jgi:hypothetical protein
VGSPDLSGSGTTRHTARPSSLRESPPGDADPPRDGATLVTAGGESLLYRPGDVVVWKADGSRVGDLAGHHRRQHLDLAVRRAAHHGRGGLVAAGLDAKDGLWAQGGVDRGHPVAGRRPLL